MPLHIQYIEYDIALQKENAEDEFEEYEEDDEFLSNWNILSEPDIPPESDSDVPPESDAPRESSMSSDSDIPSDSDLPSDSDVPSDTDMPPEPSIPPDPDNPPELVIPDESDIPIELSRPLPSLPDSSIPPISSQSEPLRIPYIDYYFAPRRKKAVDENDDDDEDGDDRVAASGELEAENDITNCEKQYSDAYAAINEDNELREAFELLEITYLDLLYGHEHDDLQYDEHIARSIRPTSGININPIIQTPPMPSSPSKPSSPPQSDAPIMFYIDETEQKDKSTINKGN